MKKTLFTLIMSIIAVHLYAQGIGNKNTEEFDNYFNMVRVAFKAEEKVLINEVLTLNPTESEKFWDIYDDFKKQEHKLTNKQIDLIKKFANDFENMSDKVAAELINEYIKIGQSHFGLLKKYHPKFAKAIGEKNTLKLYQVKNKIRIIILAQLVENVPLLGDMPNE